MARLFWIIMFCFWFAMIPMGIAIAWSIAELMSNTPNDQIRHFARRGLHNNVRALGLVMEHSGQSAAKRFLTDLNGLVPLPPPIAIPQKELNRDGFPPGLKDRHRHPFWRSKTLGLAPSIANRRLPWEILVLDSQGVELLRRPVPKWALQVPDRMHDILTQPVISPAGQQYSIIARVQQRPEWATARQFWLSLRFMRDLLNHPKQLGISMISGFLISSLVCFLLSWYLSQPVKKLRAATRRLSAGNLDVRVAQAIGGRNDQMSELGWDFDHMADRIQVLIASEQSLLNDVSHEFRSPLARLQVAVGLARHKAPDVLIPELERIEREIHRLDDLVGQVLMLSRLDANAMDGCHDYVDLPALLEDVARDAEFEASSKSRYIRVIQNLDECTVQANVSLLHSALENVIRNAVKYTHDGSTVEVLLEKRDKQQTDSCAWVRIKVCDQGNGVPEALLAKLFDPFFRVESARDRDTGGYSLGLAIAQRAIRVHGGEIRAQNRSEGGLCVIIDLPIR